MKHYTWHINYVVHSAVKLFHINEVSGNVDLNVALVVFIFS